MPSTNPPTIPELTHARNELIRYLSNYFPTLTDMPTNSPTLSKAYLRYLRAQVKKEHSPLEILNHPNYHEYETYLALIHTVTARYLPYARAYVLRKYRNHPHLDDIIQEACIALFRATLTYDPTLDPNFPARNEPTQSNFLSYATHYIRSYLHTYFVKINKGPYTISIDSLTSPESFHPTTDPTSLSNPNSPATTLLHLEAPHLRRVIAHAITRLSPKQRQLMATYLSPTDAPSLKETAALHGVSANYVRCTFVQLSDIARTLAAEADNYGYAANEAIHRRSVPVA